MDDSLLYLLCVSGKTDLCAWKPDPDFCCFDFYDLLWSAGTFLYRTEIIRDGDRHGMPKELTIKK